MKVGVDVDGVLADFQEAYVTALTKASGRSLYPYADYATRFPCWNHEKHHGYTPEEISAAWELIKADPLFWFHLPPHFGAFDALEVLYNLAQAGAEVTFITARPGINAQEQTERWLEVYSPDIAWEPKVIVSSEKGKYARDLRLDKYIDDRVENVIDVCLNAPSCQVYVMDRPWNQQVGVSEAESWKPFRQVLNSEIRRVYSVGEMFD